MSINFNYNYSNFTSNRANETGEANRAGRAGQVAHNGIITPGEQIRFTNLVNRILTENGAPTLDSIKIKTPEEVEEGLKSFGMKLNSALGSFRGKPILFDIYALMDLMQEMAQKMRDSLRELRNLENQTIQSNIRGQAAIQRSAAINSMIAGAVLCGIQATVTVVSTAKAVSKFAEQQTMMTKGGVDVMNAQNEVAKTVGNEGATNKMMEGLQQKYNDVAKDLKTGIISEADPAAYENEAKNLNAAKGKMEALGKIASAEDKISTKNAEITKLTQANHVYHETVMAEKAQPGSVPKEVLEHAQAMDAKNTTEINKLQGEVADLQKDLPALREKVGLGADESLTGGRAEEIVKNVGNEVKNAEVALEQAQGKYILAQNESAVQQAAGDFRSVRAQANDELAKTGKVSEGTQQSLKQAEAKLVLARGQQVQVANTLLKSGNLPYNDVVNSITESATSMETKAQETSISRADSILFNKFQSKLMMVQGLNQALGQFGQTLVSGIKELTSAAATELAAAQKMQEDQLDQIKDLFQQELSVIQKVFQLFEAVTQKESSTIENIIRA